MKGSVFYMLWSVLGVLVGLFLVYNGVKGITLSPFVVLIVGIFFVLKEIMDMITGG